jgi:PAS domain-containing protein
VALDANAQIGQAGAYSLCVFIFLMLVAVVHGRFSRTVLRALGNVAIASASDRSMGADDAALLFERHTRTLKRLRRERDRSRATLGSLVEAVITATEVGFVNYMNPVAEALTGIAFRDANGQPLEHVVQLTTNETKTIEFLLARLRHGEPQENLSAREITS